MLLNGDFFLLYDCCLFELPPNFKFVEETFEPQKEKDAKYFSVSPISKQEYCKMGKVI